MANQPRALNQRHTIAARRPLDRLHRLVTQTTLGRIDDAFERQIVFGRHGQPEIGHRIPDLQPLVKAWAADDAVGQADGQKAIFKSAHLVAGPHEDRHIIKAHWRHAPRAALHRFNLFTDPTGFFLAIPMANQADLFAILAGREQRLAQTPLIGRNHARGGGQNMRGRAIVFLQPHHMGTGEILFKPQDIAHLGPAPAIDRLVVITDTTDVLVRGSQQTQPHILGDIGILIFVHKDVAKPALVLLQDIFVFLKDGDHVQKDVAKIDCVQFSKPRLIQLIEINTREHGLYLGRRLSRGVVDARLHIHPTFLVSRNLVRSPSTVLIAVNDARKPTISRGFNLNACGICKLLDQSFLIVSIQNSKVGLQPHQFRMSPQLFGANRMKGAQPWHTLNGFTHQSTYAVLHLAGSFIGKRHRQNLMWTCGSRRQQMRNPRRQRLRLASTRTSQHQDRSAQCLNRLALRGVQTIKIRRTWPRHRPLAQRHGGGLKGIIFGKTAHPTHIAPTASREKPCSTSVLIVIIGP